VPGTKTDTRDRHEILVEAWARPYLEAFLRQQLPNAVLWPNVTRYQAHYQHQKAAAAVQVDDYTLRDARHSWAVRARKRGVEFEAISEQLGSSVATVHGTYARFKPTLDERHKAQAGK
jgi:integrase